MLLPLSLTKGSNDLSAFLSQLLPNAVEKVDENVSIVVAVAAKVGTYKRVVSRLKKCLVLKER